MNTVDARVSEYNRHLTNAIIKEQRQSKMPNLHFDFARNREYYKGAPVVLKTLNQRQKRKRAKH